MKHKIWLILSVVLIMFGLSLPAAAEEKSELKELFLRDLDYVYDMGGDIYSNWDLKKKMYGVDWDALYQNARQQMEQAMNLDDYQRIMTELIASVRDGHVNFTLERKSSYYMPLNFYDVNGHVIIRKIDKSAFLTPPDMAPGDEVVTYNGSPVQDRIDVISQYVSGSTDRMVRTLAILRLNSMLSFEGIAVGNPSLGIKKLGKDKVVDIEVPWIVDSDNADPTYTEAPWKIADYVEAKILPGNIGYLWIGTMMSEGEMEDRQEEFAVYVELQLLRLMNTDGLIIDVRGNGGGEMKIGSKLLPHLTDTPVNGQKISYRLSKATMIERPYIVEMEPDETTKGLFSKWVVEKVFKPVEDGTIYKGNVVMVVDSRCFSACDRFADTIASNNLALVIGTGTGGGVGYPLKFNIPSTLATVRFSTARELNVSGEYVEGTGTVPDIEAAITAKDIANDFDSVMSKARDILLEDKGGNTSAVKYMSLAVSGGGKKGFALRDEPILPASVIEDREIRLTSHEYDGF